MQITVTVEVDESELEPLRLLCIATIGPGPPYMASTRQAADRQQAERLFTARLENTIQEARDTFA